MVPKPSKAIIKNDILRLVNSATKPITGGPIKNPRKLMVETDARAALGDILVDFPARLKTIGTTDDTPKPTIKKPMVAVAILGNITAVNNPPAINTPLNCKMRVTPNLVTSQSPINLPVAMVPMKAT